MICLCDIIVNDINFRTLMSEVCCYTDERFYLKVQILMSFTINTIIILITECQKRHSAVFFLHNISPSLAHFSLGFGYSDMKINVRL